MTEKTARLHISDVTGLGGHARCFELTPPLIKDALGYKYLTIVVRRGTDHNDAEVVTLFANNRGVPVDRSIRRRSGSHVPHGDPFETTGTLNDCFVNALAHMDYEIEGYGATQLPQGLDYNPDELPE